MSARSKRPVLLVVDDDAVAQRLASGLLAMAFPDHQIETSDGTTALDLVQAHKPALVLTDLFMPSVDGFAIITTLRRWHPGIPVVVMTAHGSEQSAVSALRAGAASYVSKQNLSDELVETLRAVLAVRMREQTTREVFEHMTMLQRSFVLPNRTELVGPVVAELQSDLRRLSVCPEEDLNRFGVAMTETLINAMIHGNLGLPGSLLEKGHEAFQERIAERLSEPRYADRRVRLELRADREKAVLTVRDEGEGFDPAAVPDPTDPEMMMRSHGRGLLLIRTFMDEVGFNAVGNEITLVKYCQERRG